jgi:hypothetical protein
VVSSVRTLLDLLADASANPPDNSVKIAIITALSVVVAAAITGFATTFHRRKSDSEEESPSVASGAQNFVAELLRRAEVAERHVDTLERKNESLVQRVDELERLAWHNGIDPNTGETVMPHKRRYGGIDDGSA